MRQEVRNTKEWYRTHFEAFEQSLNGEATSRVHALRRRAIEAFDALGFPTTREEEWRFTDVSPIARTLFVPSLTPGDTEAMGEEIESLTFRGWESVRFVFVNGHYRAEFSVVPALPKGVTVTNLASALKANDPNLYCHLGRYVQYDENAFTALSTAFLFDGAFIHIPDDVVLDVPIHLVFFETSGGVPLAAHPRNLIIVGKRSKVSIVETYAGRGDEPYLTNAVTEFVVGEGASVEHDKLQAESLTGFHIGTVHFEQHEGSTVVSNAINFGGALVRNTITAVLGAERCEATLNGLSLTTGTQLVDHHTTIDHAQPKCASHELYKSILDGNSRGVFNGKIFVRKDAQKTDAKQTNKTLLLSDHATIDTKPQLEIFANDVKCTHGATVGHLDEEQLFYLRSRGIGEETAKDILTFAFASDIINRVHVEPLRSQVDAMLQERLRQGRTLEL
ncbi:MAG: Fe-S cluster assembly protein SufD [Ignavibacteria bacterium]